MDKSISVVIPLAPGESVWKELVSALENQGLHEIILAAGESTPDISGHDVKVVNGTSGRAQQMNEGASKATGDFVWFLHADSRLEADAVKKLHNNLETDQTALWFFDLRFSSDGPWAMKLNEWAVRWRAGVLKIPFGDQGFCISRDLFLKLGGYREDVSYGEDHLFVWKVRQAGYRVQSVGASIYTSARKYQKNGWFQTTLKHVWLTFVQGLPQRTELLRRQITRFFL